MKNAIVCGLIIGVLSSIWIFVMNAMGYSMQDNMEPIQYLSVLIPLVVLYFGIRDYRKTACKGEMGFLSALIQSFKILLIGGIIASAGIIIYLDEFQQGQHIQNYVAMIFGALLVGVLFSLGVSALLTNKPNKVD